jgi:hypothetical protein
MRKLLELWRVIYKLNGGFTMKPFKVGQIVKGFDGKTYTLQLVFGRERNSVYDLCTFRYKYDCMLHEILRLPKSITCTSITPTNTVFKEIDINSGI